MVEFVKALSNIAQTVKSKKELILTEEATKMTFIMPFLQALGYNVFDPSVVIPEYTADLGTKKGEKVDYAIMKDGKPFIIIEAKNHTENLDNHNNQLIRYFQTSTDIQFGILTNGIEYRFFTDIEKENLLDKTPFLIVDFENFNPDKDAKVLSQFISSNIDLNNIKNTAIEKKYNRGIQKIFKEELENPSDEFISVFAKRLTDKRMTNNVLESFKVYIKKALREYINDQIYNEITNIKNKLQEEIKENEQQIEPIKNDKEIITTEEELQSFYIVRSILSEQKAILDDITYKDTLSYFSILYQGKVTKWICRLYLNPSKKYIAFPNSDGTEQKEIIERIDDIFNFKDTLVKSYLLRIN